MRHGSLFSGIGGFDLAAEWMGWENVFHCEWNPFGQRILKHYWPNAKSYENICTTNFSIHRGGIDIITGGFPCQPYSSAGKRLGKDDERHLWPEMLRAIREIEPTYIVGENVRGLLNWNGGLVFDEVCAELENIGYQVAPCLIPACGKDAPHRRERIWFVAYSNRNGFNERNGQYEVNTSEEGKYAQRYIEPSIGHGNIADTDKTGLQSKMGNKKLERGRFSQSYQRLSWHSFPTESPICGGDDGISTELDAITFSKWRQESIKAYGNAIVPQVAFEIFKAIQQTINRTGERLPG